MKTDWANATLRAVYKNPFGNDVLRKVLKQLNLPSWAVTNPIVGNLTLGTLGKLSGGRLTPEFRQSLAAILSIPEDDAPPGEAASQNDRWWRDAVFYQIYPRSFCDSNGDGVGDIGGIISRLDYLKELGADCIWLSPIYDSPDDDNGYDIRDYRKIAPEYGTGADFDNLLAAVKARGMRLIMDLVVNLTSDEHEWFQAAIADGGSRYRDYYVTRRGGGVPNNWTSFFSGSAWNYYAEQDMWALHTFSKKQIDLNWKNANMRAEIYDMIRYWLNKGVDGFRLDVINFISKAGGLPNGDVTIGALMGYTGIEHYFFGPKLLAYLREMRKEAFAPFDAFTVGETPALGFNMSKALTEPKSAALDCVFAFDHLENPGKTRFDDYAYDLNYLKWYLIEQTERAGNVRPTLFFENHDNPRMVSKIDPTNRYAPQIARLLAVLQLTLPGIPFIYQGQELGATNAAFTDISEIKDVESVNYYAELLEKGETPEAAFKRVLAGTRDHARKPVDWNGAADNHTRIFFRALIDFRRGHKALTDGSTIFRSRRKKDYFLYERRFEGEALVIECNLCKGEIASKSRGRLLMSTYDEDGRALRPYEARITQGGKI